MTDPPHGLARGLTNYGDADFQRTGCVSGNFQLPSTISFRGRYSLTV
jgi:hypothetical protein